MKEMLRRLKENMSAQPVKDGNIVSQMSYTVDNWNPEKPDNNIIDERLNELKNILREIPAAEGDIIPLMRKAVDERTVPSLIPPSFGFHSSTERFFQWVTVL